MTCPDTGRWRGWLDDEPAWPAPELETHLAACSICTETVDELRSNEFVAAGALAQLAPAAQPNSAAVALARRRLAVRKLTEACRPAGVGQFNPLKREHPRMTHSMPLQRWRTAMLGLAAALALSFFVVTPQGQALASQFLSQFRGQQIAVITVDPTQMANPYKELEQLGTVSGLPSRPPRQSVDSLDEASRRVGFTVKRPDPASLPAGLKDAQISVVSATQPRFTFDRAKAEAYFKSINRTDLNMPQKLEGATLVVNMPAGVVLMYPGANNTEYPLAIAEFNQLTAAIEGNNGATLDDVRTFLLKLPDIPPSTANQLSQISDWKNTLPLPIPVDKLKSQDTKVAGVQGILLDEISGLGTMVIWPDGSQVNAVGGPYKADVVKGIANGLK